MITLHAVSNLPLDYIEPKKKLTLVGISIKRNYSPKFIILNKNGNPITNVNINLNNGTNNYDIISDSSGYVEVNGLIPRNELYNIIISSPGFQTIRGNLLLTNEFKENTVILHKINSLITTSKGYAVSMNPTDPENTAFN